MPLKPETEWLCDTVGSHLFIHDEKERTIAHLGPAKGISPKQRKEHGNLISAAPDLYMAAVAICREHSEDGGISGSTLGPLLLAIAKAQGGEQPDAPK